MRKVSKPGLTPQGTEKLSADVILPKAPLLSGVRTTERIIVVGASTGGTDALKILFQSLPHDTPGMVVVQHMQDSFTAAFARQMDGLSKMEIREGRNNDLVAKGTVLIAPGDRHALLRRSGVSYYLELNDGPRVSRHRPSVDVLFRSAARAAGKNAIAVILTGMGDDGANGMLEIKEAGGHTIAQDEDSSVVFGMPKEAIKLGAALKILPLDKIAGEILSECRKR